MSQGPQSCNAPSSPCARALSRLETKSLMADLPRRSIHLGNRAMETSLLLLQAPVGEQLRIAKFHACSPLEALSLLIIVFQRRNKITVFRYRPLRPCWVEEKKPPPLHFV
ncbi:hypothetical protein CMUS01_05849 [Colletotrichum musicola]|uniref:Uncharacterized protein n=1 Tax=Colletotrichum musicola TaxID=2175873 RepID=A0A8H6KPG0_9PEZI|nr:hypothetical protein CMUS01_05849 [Colletotrichum musicola]